MTLTHFARRLHDDYDRITSLLGDIEGSDDSVSVVVRQHYEESLARTAEVLLSLIRTAQQTETQPETLLV